MPRSLRLILPGVAVHIVQRGHDRAPCFRERSDYLVYLMHLRELAAKLGCAVHAYCLMTNHIHLLVTSATGHGCTALMQNLGQRYVQYFNRHHGRRGTLWEGRFRSCMVESARYVIACYRYIELNPVRAGMVAYPGLYEWSSYGGNAGDKVDKIVTPHDEFLALGGDPTARSRSYRALLDADDESQRVEIRRATNGGYPLASDAFKARLKAEGWRIEPGRSGRPSPTEEPGSDPGFQLTGA